MTSNTYLPGAVKVIINGKTQFVAILPSKSNPHDKHQKPNNFSLRVFVFNFVFFHVVKMRVLYIEILI